MKNRYLKNARIPEKKVRELLNLFCEDRTATQIANISGISRITVNAYLKLIRTQIAQYCEEHKPYYHHNLQLPVIANKQSAPDVSCNNENNFYGIFKSEQAIYTSNISHVDAPWLNNWVRGKIRIEKSILEQNDLHIFDAIADFSRARLYRVNNGVHFIKGKSKIDEIDLFWGILKSRIVKFRGLNTGTSYLHIKESEFRYNNRNADLFALIHSLIQKRPLHYLKHETALL
jgi:transposase